jgi:hypothetical protein
MDIKKNYILEVNYDADISDSPRSWDPVGTLFMLGKFGKYTNLNEETEMDDYSELDDRDDIVVLPIYKYEHSGIALNTTGFSCPWDSCKVGYIYTTKENYKSHYRKDATDEEIKKCLTREITQLHKYISGEVYRFELKSISFVVIDGKEFNNEETEDQCSGFYDIEDIIAQIPDDIKVSIFAGDLAEEAQRLYNVNRQESQNE